MSNDIITSKDIQNRYQKLYTFMMQYLWEYRVVESLANLEIACYRAFPDKDDMVKYLAELRRSISETYSELSEDDQPEFKDTFERFASAIEDYDSDNAEVELYAVSMPVELPGADNSAKKVFRIGDIELSNPDEDEDAEEDVGEESEQLEESEDKLANPFEEE